MKSTMEESSTPRAGGDTKVMDGVDSAEIGSEASVDIPALIRKLSNAGQVILSFKEKSLEFSKSSAAGEYFRICSAFSRYISRFIS